MFCLSRYPQYFIIEYMKFRNRQMVFVTVMALLGYGLLPGMVLCQSEEGHVAVETALVRCCSSFVPTAPNSSRTISGYESESEVRNPCGPCSDTFISTDSFTVPTHEQLPGLSSTQIATTDPNDLVVGAKKLFMGIVNPAQLALVPVKTTVLLL
jgi:hypothetical protein